jgi:Putative peptidoglycan binding domain
MLLKLKRMWGSWRRIGVAIVLSFVSFLWINAAEAQPVPSPALTKQATNTAPPQPMTAAERAELKDPFFQLVLKDHANVKTVAEINQFLKPAGQDVFVVDERIADTAPKVNGTPASRRAVITPNGTTNQLALDQNVFFSIFFNSEQFNTGNFIEAMGWDDSQSRFNYYKFDQSGGEAAPSWKFRGSSKDADILPVASRQNTCMQCHINGSTVMKELLLPWNNWNSFSAPTNYLTKGAGNWAIAQAANSPLKDLAGAQQLESAAIFPTITRHNERRINALKSADGQSITDAKRLLKPLFVTTEFNIISDATLSPLHPFNKSPGGPGNNISVPTSFFLNSNVIQNELGVSANFFDFSTISTADYAHLVKQTKTSLAGTQPGDNNFAWFVPEPSFIDTDFVSQLIQKGIVPREFVAAALAVDLENPVLSRDRAKLWDAKIIPAQFKIGAQNDLIAQTIKNLQALQPANGTPEATFLQLLRSPNAVAALQDRVNQYVNREGQRLDLTKGATKKTRSDEWIRLYKLMLQRREAVANDPVLKSLNERGTLLFAKGDVTAAVTPLPSSTTPPPARPTLRQGDRGDNVVFLQQRLKALGFFNGVIDGDFGPLTKAAVIAMQKKSNLTADGIVGPRSWAVLQA